jgi:hypothetical protein
LPGACRTNTYDGCQAVPASPVPPSLRDPGRRVESRSRPFSILYEFVPPQTAALSSNRLLRIHRTWPTCLLYSDNKRSHSKSAAQMFFRVEYITMVRPKSRSDFGRRPSRLVREGEARNPVSFSITLMLLQTRQELPISEVESSAAGP